MTSAMTADEVNALFACWRDALLRHDAAGLAACYADNCILESPSYGSLTGRAQAEASWRNWFETFPDSSATFVELLIAGNRVAQTYTVHGTDTGGFVGQAPTGRHFRSVAVGLYDLKDGRIVREQRVFDVTGVLLQLARREGLAEDVPRSYREALASARLEQEIKIAAEIQQALMPAAQYKTAGVEAAGSSFPCRAIGGDFLDYFGLADGAFGFVLGDVAGKGPPAALLAARVQGLLAAYSKTARGPADAIRHVNQEVVGRTVQSRFATLLHGVLTLDGRLTYCNAGHNPALIVGNAGVRTLETGGVPVGLFEDALFREETVQLDAGDVLVVFSDGVVEAFNADGAEFGEASLLACVTAYRGLPPNELLQRIMTSVREFVADADQHDDMTALIVLYHPAIA
jgi:phosphoserine phosphatase RsbU/P